MIKKALPVLFGAVALTGFGATAQATTPVVRIYMANTDRSPQYVSANCDGGLHLHTTLFNDQPGNFPHEKVKIVREDTGAIVFGPVVVDLNVPYPVNMPYLPDVAFNAIAVPDGSAFPTNMAQYNALLAAHEIDNSQLFAPGTGHDKYSYPPLPEGCKLPPVPTPTPTPTPKPCTTATQPPVKEEAILPSPSCSPVPTPSATPTPTKTLPSPCASENLSALVLPGCHTPTPTPTPTTPKSTITVTPTALPSATPTGPVLAHTGASVIPYAAGAATLLVAGGGAVLYSRKLGKRS